MEHIFLQIVSSLLVGAMLLVGTVTAFIQHLNYADTVKFGRRLNTRYEKIKSWFAHMIFPVLTVLGAWGSWTKMQDEPTMHNLGAVLMVAAYTIFLTSVVTVVRSAEAQKLRTQRRT